jgi:hypothetical protein
VQLINGNVHDKTAYIHSFILFSVYPYTNTKDVEIVKVVVQTSAKNTDVKRLNTITTQ